MTNAEFIQKNCLYNLIRRVSTEIYSDYSIATTDQIELFTLLMPNIFIEAVGWFSTGFFLISIDMRQRSHLHALGILTSITTGFYAYSHGATAIWVKWIAAFFFHFYMWLSLRRTDKRVPAI